MASTTMLETIHEKEEETIEIVKEGLLGALFKEERIFEAILTAEIIDREKHLIPVAEFEKLFNIMKEKAPIVVHHTSLAVGKILDLKRTSFKGKPAILLRGQIHKGQPIYDEAWDSLLEGKFTGLSFGGRGTLTKVYDPEQGGYYRVSDLELWEVSLADKPVNQYSTILQVLKKEYEDNQEEEEEKEDQEEDQKEEEEEVPDTPTKEEKVKDPKGSEQSTSEEETSSTEAEEATTTEEAETIEEPAEEVKVGPETTTEEERPTNPPKEKLDDSHLSEVAIEEVENPSTTTEDEEEKNQEENILTEEVVKELTDNQTATNTKLDELVSGINNLVGVLTPKEPIQKEEPKEEEADTPPEEPKEDEHLVSLRKENETLNDRLASLEVHQRNLEDSLNLKRSVSPGEGANPTKTSNLVKAFKSGDLDIVEELNNLQIAYGKGRPKILPLPATEKFFALGNGYLQ